jgi:hypothetical protein
MSTSHDTESDAATQMLDIVAVLVFDPASRRAWLERHSPEMQLLFDHMFLLLGALADKADWDTETLMIELGCRRRTSSQIGSLTESELRRCTAFFAWIGDLGRKVPASPMIMRTLISAASGTYADSRQDLGACQRAMQQTLGPHDALTPMDLLWIGAVGGAFSGAMRALPGPAGNDARAAAAGSPFTQRHVPASTLDAWLRDETHPRAMPVEQRARLDEHIPACEVCNDAAVHRAAVLGLRDRPAPALAEPVALLPR